MTKFGCMRWVRHLARTRKQKVRNSCGWVPLEGTRRTLEDNVKVKFIIREAGCENVNWVNKGQLAGFRVVTFLP
jgi:hypothetical protein